MTEEIIVDGIDVSECSADKKKMKDGLYCFWEGGNCEYNKYCYYKECKRLEQENEKLKKEVKQIGSDFIKKGDYARELEQENRELKAYKDINEDLKKAWDELNKKYTEVLKLAKENADSNEYCLQELEQENKELKNEINKLGKKHEDYCNTMYWQMKEQMDKYRSALEEIREIANENNFCASYACPPMFKILDKINEVLND